MINFFINIFRKVCRLGYQRHLYCKGNNHEKFLKSKFYPKLTDSDVLKIKIRLFWRIPHSAIAKEFRVSKSTITKINTKKIWKGVVLGDVD